MHACRLGTVSSGKSAIPAKSISLTSSRWLSVVCLSGPLIVGGRDARATLAPRA